jgi:hypothetical protein
MTPADIFFKTISHQGWKIFLSLGIGTTLILGSLLFSFSKDFKIQSETAENWIAGKGFVYLPKNESEPRSNRLWPPHYMPAPALCVRLGMTTDWAGRILWAASCALLTLFFAGIVKNAMGDQTKRLFWGLLAFLRHPRSNRNFARKPRGCRPGNPIQTKRGR